MDDIDPLEAFGAYIQGAFVGVYGGYDFDNDGIEFGGFVQGTAPNGLSGYASVEINIGNEFSISFNAGAGVGVPSGVPGAVAVGFVNLDETVTGSLGIGIADILEAGVYSVFDRIDDNKSLVNQKDFPDSPTPEVDLSTLGLEKPGVVEFDKLSLLDQKLQQDIDKQIAAEKAAAAQAALESKARYDQNSRDNGGYEQGNGSHVGRNDSMHGGGHCFTGDVPVRMADGTCKPISDVKIGDHVRSFDANGQIGTNRVIHLHIQPNAEVYDLAGIGVTASHPFLSSDGIFRPIESFEEADFLVREDGAFSPVPKLIKRPGPEDVYNLTVEGTHTYIAGGWRVHNKWGAPVVLDIDGDGVELVSQEDSHAFFDLDGDGFKENVGWVSSDDALLAIDIDGDGTIDKAEEVNFTLHHEDAETDLDGVRLAFDSNQNGVLDAQDERFEDFRVWQDADGDGVADEGELKTLAEAGISSIGLEAERTDQDIDGNILHRTTEMTMADGTTAEVGDAAFLMSDVSYRENEDGTLDFQSRDGSTAKFGTGGDDVIAAGDDAALIVGGAGDDLLAGGGQNDWIVGGDGADTLRGGGGHDNLFFDGQDEVHGGAGFDIAVSTDDGGVSLDLGNAEIEVAIGGAGDDSFTGSEQADVIVGGGGADVINAGAGDDLIVVDELDEIDGGSGVDTVIFETSEDVSFDLSQHHVEIAVGGSGDDTLTTANGYGGVMSGGAGDDTISGSWNTDVLIGGAGSDILKGGAGDDTYRFGRGDGEDTVNDTYSWGKSELRSHYIGKGYPAKYVDNYLNTLPDDYTVEFDAGDDTLELGPGISPDDILFRTDGDDLVLALKDPDNPDAAFEDLSDKLRIEEWSDSNNRIEVLQFASGTTLDLKAMLDNLGLADDGTVLDVGAAMAAKLGDLANEVGEGGLGLAGTSSDEILVGSDAEDVIVAGGGNDTVIGGDGDDLLFGQDGNDVLSGGEGTDLLNGGAGDDTLLSDGNDTLLGGAGTDTVKFTSDDGVQFDLSDAEIESVLGSLGDDELSALGLEDAIYMDGGVGNDTLRSGAGADSLLGGSGDDILDGGSGDDILDGGAGDDTVVGGQGNDLFIGSDGGDTLLGGEGEDTVTFIGSSTGINLSLVSGGTGGEAAEDVYDDIENVVGTQYNDVVTGSEMNNSLSTGDGDDTLSGNAGNDYLAGGRGNDEYRFERGDGEDLIHDTGSSAYNRTLDAASADRISFGEGIRPNDLIMLRSGNDIIIVVRENEQDTRPVSDIEDRIVIKDGVKSQNGIERLVFADGSIAKFNPQTFSIEYDVLRSNAEDGDLVDIFVDPIAARLKSAGLNVAETELENFADGDEIRDKRAQRQNALSSSQNQAAQAAEVMLLASLGVAAGAAVNPALAGGDEVSDNFASLLPQDSGSDVSPDSGQTLDVYPGDAGSVNEHEESPNQEVLPQDQQGEQSEASGSYDNGSAVSSDSGFSLNADGLQDQVGDVAVDLTESQDAESPVLNNLQEQESEEQGNTSDLADAMLAEEQRRLAAVIGTGGDDVLFADFNTQYQQVDGQGGHDTLVMRIPANQPFDAGAHDIEVVVGSGASDYLHTSSTENVTFYGNGGNDTLLGGSGNDILAGGAGADRLSGGDGRDTAFYGAALDGVSVDLMAGTGTDGEAAGDILESIENVIGSSFDDTILGNGVSNDITGGAGNDYVDAAAGDDIVRGGAGADTLIGGAGIDALDYTSSTEAVQIDLAAGTGLGGDAEGDVISQFEIVLGSHGSDVLSGGAGNELLDGGRGDDLLHGRDGNDDLIGGVGNDTLIGGLGADNLDGGDGFDWASYADAAEGVAVRLDLGKGTGGEALGDLYSGIEAVAGSAFADTIIGDGNANHIRGGAGSDRLDGGSGNDILSGGDGDDVIVGGIGADTIDGGAGVDVIDYAASHAGIHISLADGTGSGGLAEGDRLADIENVIGSSFDDVLIGNDDGNVFKGGSGNDTFIGGAGEDTFVVDGDYRDYQLVHGDDGYATLSGTDGTDILRDVENVIIGGRSFYGDQNNSPAFFGSKHVTTDEDAVTLISKESLLTEFYDLEGDSFSISAVSDATHGAVSIVGDDVRFVPVANYNGPASFKYTVTDENGAAHIYEVGMTINAVNDAPTAYISGNRMVASDVDGDALSYSIIGRSSGVSAGIDGNGNFSYSASGYGDFSFTMRASDGHGAYVDRSFSFTKEAPPDEEYDGGDDHGGTDGRSEGNPGCFVAGTPVLMASGLTKPIEDVVVGDMVMAFDGFGALVPRAVLTLIRAKDKEVIEVNGVKSTFNHPFLTEEGHFKVAAQLSMFDRLVNAEGELVRVKSIVNRGERANVFNFEVEEHHTYVAGGYRVHNWKPVIVDLNGNGVEFMGASMSTARFDVDGDGNLERTAWVASSDGLLVFDHDHDGMISNVNEVALSMYGQEGMTDLQGLAYGFDSNRDGVFNHEDDQWSSFAIWQDANSNGVSEAGEVISLDDIGISSIGLNRDDNQYSEDGVTVYGHGSFEWSDGSSGQLADTAFEATSENFWDDDVSTVLKLEAETIAPDPVQMAELLVMHNAGAAGGADNIHAPSTDIFIVDDDYLALVSANA